MTAPRDEPVAVVGAGAIGILLGATLARAGHPVTVCGRQPVTQLTLDLDGQVGSHPVTHATTPAEIAGHRLVVVAVKAHHTPDVHEWVEAAAGPDTVVVLAQNGIEHAERVRAWLGESVFVPALVYNPVERTAPGVAVVRRPADRDLVVPAGEGGRRVADHLIAGGLRVDVAADFRTEAWRKLMTDTSSVLTTLTSRPTAVVREPGVARLALDLLDEAAEVARAGGADVDAAVPGEILAWLQALPDGSTTSMLQDRQAGRPLEHDALLGAVLRAGRRHGVDLPTSRSMYALLDALDTQPTVA